MRLSDAETLARQLMSKHGLGHWEFKFDGGKRRFGYCRYPHGGQPGVISLSRYLTELNVEAEVRNVILHEIAHALTPTGELHGPEWKRVAREIGCTGDRCYDEAVVATPDAPWTIVCPNCGIEHKRYRRRGMG